MRNYILYISAALCSLIAGSTAFAQQVSNPVDNIPVTPPITQPATLTYPGLKNMTWVTLHNYVRTQVPDIPVQTMPASESYVRQTTSYFDGLGRPLQTVSKKSHPAGHDLVSVNTYDTAGRPTYQYLPYAKPVAVSDGTFNPTVDTRMHNFYDQAGPDEQPYGKTEYDNSPLNRIMKQMSSGKSWVGSGRGITYNYRSNLAGEVRLWKIAGGNKVIESTNFNAGSLQSWVAYNSSTVSVENQRAKIIATGAWKGIRKDFTVVPGKTYRVTMDIDKGTTNNGIAVTVVNASSFAVITSGTINQTIEGVNLSFTAPVASLALLIETSGSTPAGSFQFYVDNYVLEEVQNGGPTSTESFLPSSTTTYAPGELSVTEITDEDGNKTIEYKDKQDKLILKKTLASGTNPPVTDHNGYACVYNVYDDLNQLRFVLTPEAVKQCYISGNTWIIKQGVADGLCFSYTYDEKGRQVERKLPGKELEEFVYDKRDRLVMQRDGNLKTKNKWLITFYDALNRPTVTSTILTASTRQTMINYVEDAVSYPNTSFLYYIKNYNLMNVYPTSYSGSDMLSYTYYDDYTNLTSFSYDGSQFDNITLPANGTVVPSIRTNMTRGLVTGRKIRVIDPDTPTANTWLASINYYDDKGRLIQTQSQNIKGGIDISSNLYHFQGMLYKNILRHNNPVAKAIPNTNDGAKVNLKIQKTFNRNLKVGGGSDQINTVTQKIENGIEYQFANYFYDHLGRVVTKQTPAYEMLNEYSIRGFMHHIQYRNLNNTTNANHIFDERLYYDKGFQSKLYNGNIAGITWKNAGNTAPTQAYGYSYDKLSRLNHAEYRKQNFGTSTWLNSATDYTASNISYDLNGNIQTMNQRSVDLAISTTTPINMDQLTYTYAPKSNQLIKVVDAVPVAGTPTLPDFKDKANLTSEYAYDVNGNLISDANKQITSITYDLNNKPEKITIQNQGTITYVHDAEGNVLEKRVFTNSSSSTDTFDYIGNFVYKNRLLQYINNEEGRARPLADSFGNTKFAYDYFVKDHLGNVRSTVTAKPIDQMYLASHEIAMANVEQLLFDNIPNVRGGKPGTTDPDDGMAARLNADDPNTTIGTAIMLKTMPGDKFTISVDAYYEGEYTQHESASGADVVAALTSALLGGNTYAGVPIAELPDNARIVKQTLENPALANQLNDLIDANNDPNAPKAHLNVLFFDDRMNLIPDAGGIQQVPVITTGGLVNWENLTITPQPGGSICCISPGGGYVIIYIDNQSIGKDVWFDNLAIEHYTGEVLEESHYYPFGLTINTSQSGNPSIPKNDIKFQSQRHENDLGLNVFSFKYRDHDPQIGRFWQIDPLSEDYVHNSTYAFSENKVTSHFELEGLESMTIHYRTIATENGPETYSYEDNTNYGYGSNGIYIDDVNEVDNIRTGNYVPDVEISDSRPSNLSWDTRFGGVFGNAVLRSPVGKAVDNVDHFMSTASEVGIKLDVGIKSGPFSYNASVGIFSTTENNVGAFAGANQTTDVGGKYTQGKGLSNTTYDKPSPITFKLSAYAVHGSSPSSGLTLSSKNSGYTSVGLGRVGLSKSTSGKSTTHQISLGLGSNGNKPLNMGLGVRNVNEIKIRTQTINLE